MPCFGPDNWTSELRIEVPGFDAYQSASLSDITYADCKGILTDLVYGAEKKREWNGRWPIYHLEVKSTTGVCEEPFHMSARQLGIVSFRCINYKRLELELIVIYHGAST